MDETASKRRKLRSSTRNALNIDDSKVKSEERSSSTQTTFYKSELLDMKVEPVISVCSESPETNATTEKEKGASGFTKMKPELITFLSISESIILSIFSYINQIDTINIRLVNKELYRLGSIKLFNSIFVYLPEDNSITVVGISKSKNVYLPFQTQYTIVNGFNDFNKVLGKSQLSLVKNVLLRIKNPNSHSDYVYTYLTEKCPWITVDVEMFDSTMFQKQFARLDKISQLRVHNKFQFSTNISDNFTIKQLHIKGSEKIDSDPLRLIPHLKALNTLCICSNVKNVLSQFKHRKISKLKIKHLGFHVPQLPIRKMGDVFILSDITSLELIFDNNITPYSDLHWLSLNATNLRSIGITWSNASFRKIMEMFWGHKLYQIKLHTTSEEKKNFTAQEIKTIIEGHKQSVLYVAVTAGAEFSSTAWESNRIHQRTKAAAVNTGSYSKKWRDNFPRERYPNLKFIRINNDVNLL
ncbi:uncharacterized protein SPAPADRAFT_49409 [Spathaspora passalidarum NRRL Y-27907]|uniref:F-box domain-containing protein n=1 Tax=Spathaspora passalidarum (strain NRRL Y-27907 / 11-Y1) TaxID=619300 RepID=G3AI51_SPAPN|nr:uncharacterized protein SPAPADRAFT_49409 [Spathaspora passalidarum NRRL Y-27907]EGW34365.1 hypothetical protein SPAPADRAFT_49409 [Spathaspora passalidarum NRRL Y-27907]